jgi:hypothetical protein
MRFPAFFSPVKDSPGGFRLFSLVMRDTKGNQNGH